MLGLGITLLSKVRSKTPIQEQILKITSSRVGLVGSLERFFHLILSRGTSTAWQRASWLNSSNLATGNLAGVDHLNGIS